MTKREFRMSINTTSAKRMGKEKFLELHKGIASKEELSKEFNKVVPPKEKKKSNYGDKK